MPRITEHRHFPFGRTSGLVPYPPWRIGFPPPELRIGFPEMFEKFVKDMKLKPADQAHLASLVYDEPAPAATVKAAARVKPRPFPGGMRIPHFHLRDDIFLLDDRQWDVVSKALLDTFQQKLAGMQRVSFDQVMDISETMHGL